MHVYATCPYLSENLFKTRVRRLGVSTVTSSGHQLIIHLCSPASSWRLYLWGCPPALNLKRLFQKSPVKQQHVSMCGGISADTLFLCGREERSGGEEGARDKWLQMRNDISSICRSTHSHCLQLPFIPLHFHLLSFLSFPSAPRVTSFPSSFQLSDCQLLPITVQPLMQPASPECGIILTFNNKQLMITCMQTKQTQNPICFNISQHIHSKHKRVIFFNDGRELGSSFPPSKHK